MTSFKLKLLAASGLLVTIAANGNAIAVAQEAPSEAEQEEAETDDLLQDTIIVEGIRSSIANSIDEKRLADTISDTLSADQADRFPDNNIGEALARIPGISFQRDNNSGDGEFISIRGLDAQYNTVLYDGLRTGTSDEFRRTALDVVTGSGVSSIQVIKAPLPVHASEGIGGIVDIRSRGALQRSDGISLRAEVSDNSFADDNGYELAGSYTKEVNDKFGFYLNGRYRKRFIDSFQINPATTVPDLLGPIPLLNAGGGVTVLGNGDGLELVPTEFLPIGSFTSEQINYTHDDIEREEFTISGNIEWEVAPHTTLLIGGRHEEKTDEQDTNTIEFDVDNSFVDGINTFTDPELNFRAAVEDDEEIESRLFLRSETRFDQWDIDFAAGWSRAFRDRPIREINFEQELEEVPSSPGTSTADERTFTFAPFDLGIGDGLFPGPVPLNSTVFLEALNPFCVDEDGDSCGEIADLNYELEDSRENIRYTGRLDLTRDFSEQGGALQNIKFGAQWEISEFEDRDIDVSFVDDTFGPNGEFLGTDANNELGDSNVQITDIEGLITSDIVSFNPIGNPFRESGFLGIPQFNHSVLRQVYSGYQNGFFAAGVDPRQSDIIEAEEEFLTAYAQAKFTFGKLDVIGGARVEQYDADFEGALLFDVGIDFDDVASGTADDSINLTAPQSARVATSASNTEVLPRIAATYHWSDELKIRGSYTTALSRPTFDLLTGRIEGDFAIEIADGVDIASASINDIVDAEAAFEIGNPDLRNAYAQNFDISVEYYADSSNAFSVAVFYKEIDDFIFNSFATDASVNSSSIDDPGALFAGLNFQGLAGFDVIEQLGGFQAISQLPVFGNNIQQARNGEKAEIYGLEIGFIHTFDYLPGVLSNFGFIGNATFTDSETTINLGTLGADDALVVLGFAEAGDDLIQEFPFFNSPEEIYNFTLFYQNDNLEANLSYRDSGVQLEEIEAFGISQFQQGRAFVDLDIEYTFDDVGPLDRVTLYFEGSDLTDNGEEFSVFETRGTSRAFNDNSTFNGRTFTFGTRIRF